MTTEQRSQPDPSNADQWLRAIARVSCCWPPFVPMAAAWRPRTPAARR